MRIYRNFVLEIFVEVRILVVLRVIDVRSDALWGIDIDQIGVHGLVQSCVLMLDCRGDFFLLEVQLSLSFLLFLVPLNFFLSFFGD